MDIQLIKNKLIKEISEIESLDIIIELEKSLGKILFQDRMNMQGESITIGTGNQTMTNEEAIRILELVDDIQLKNVQEENVYRDRLVTSVDYLAECKRYIFTNLLNVAMAGEFKEIDDAFEKGETFEFDIEQFRNSKDINVEKLVLLYDNVSETMESLMNLNSIENPEDRD